MVIRSEVLSKVVRRLRWAPLLLCNVLLIADVAIGELSLPVSPTSRERITVLIRGAATADVLLLLLL